MLQKYKAEIADKVKEILSLETFTSDTVETTKTEGMIKKIEDINFDDVTTNRGKQSGEIQKEKIPEFKEATKLNFADVKVISTGEETKKKRGNNNKIQKVDFDFDFDNFSDVNFSSFTANNETNGKNETNFDEEFSMTKKKKNFEDEEEQESSYKPKISKEEINKKFANKKAISSDDYARLEEDPHQNDQLKSKINSMKYSKAISSADLYGEPEEGSI